MYYRRNQNSSSSKLLKSSSKRKFLSLTKDESKTNKMAQSMVTLRPSNSKTNQPLYNSQVRSNSLACSSSTQYLLSQPRLIVRETIKAVPINFSYHNKVPSKQEIISSNMIKIERRIEEPRLTLCSRPDFIPVRIPQQVPHQIPMRII